MKNAVLAIQLILASAIPARAQGLVDLVGKKDSPPGQSGSLPAVRTTSSNGRLDLALSPDVRALVGDPQARSINLGAAAQWNPVCGKFDVKADFQALLGKEAREEYVKGFITAGVGELLGSGMELFCQSMPTACSILQNNNIAANLKLLYSNDLCTSLEQSVMSGARRGRAEAIHRCIQRKQSEGKTKDEAERACLSDNPEITSFDGRVVANLDLNREIRKYVTFSDGASKLLDDLVQDRRLGSRAVTQDVRPNALAERYETLHDQFSKRWLDAIATSKGGANGSTDLELAGLVPAGAPPVTRMELELLARRTDLELQSLVASVSSAAALLALTRELNEVERKLEAVRTSPALEGNIEHSAYLESVLARLRAERERLLRLYADQERFAQVLAAGHASGQAEVSRTRVESMKRAVLRESSIEQRLRTRPFGTPDGSTGSASSRGGARASTPAAQANACDNCGMEYSIGGRR